MAILKINWQEVGNCLWSSIKEDHVDSILWTCCNLIQSASENVIMYDCWSLLEIVTRDIVKSWMKSITASRLMLMLIENTQKWSGSNGKILKCVCCNYLYHSCVVILMNGFSLVDYEHLDVGRVDECTRTERNIKSHYKQANMLERAI